MRARSELRTGRRAVVALGLLVGLVSGVVIAAAAAASRTSSAYDRFVVATGFPNVIVGSRDPAAFDGIAHQVERLPLVVEAKTLSRPDANVTDRDGNDVFEGGVNVCWAPFDHPGARSLTPKR